MTPRAPGVAAASTALFATDHRYPFKITIRCQCCGGENVGRDATARWCDTAQKWELGGVNDDGFCDDCDTEIKLVERFTDDTGADLGPVTRGDLYEGEAAPDDLED